MEDSKYNTFIGRNAGLKNTKKMTEENRDGY